MDISGSEEDDVEYFFPRVVEDFWEENSKDTENRKKLIGATRVLSICFHHLQNLTKNERGRFDTDLIPKFSDQKNHWLEQSRSNDHQHLWKTLHEFLDIQNEMLNFVSKMQKKCVPEHVVLTAEFLKRLTIFSVELLKIFGAVCGDQEIEPDDLEFFEKNKLMLKIGFCELDAALETPVGENRDDSNAFLTRLILTSLVHAVHLMAENWTFRLVSAFGSGKEWRGKVKAVRERILLLESCFSNPWPTTFERKKIVVETVQEKKPITYGQEEATNDGETDEEERAVSALLTEQYNSTSAFGQQIPGYEIHFFI